MDLSFLLSSLIYWFAKESFLLGMAVVEVKVSVFRVSETRVLNF